MCHDNLGYLDLFKIPAKPPILKLWNEDYSAFVSYNACDVLLRATSTTLSTVESAELFGRVKNAVQSGKSLSTIKAMVAIHPKVLEMVNTSIDKSTLLNIVCCCSPPVQHEIVAFLVHQCPRSMTILNSLRSTPLHCASYHKAPLKTVMLLYENYPNAVKMQNYHGNTPLLLATSAVSSFDVICYLADKWPVATLLSNERGNSIWDFVDHNILEYTVTCLKKKTIVALCAMIKATFDVTRTLANKSTIANSLSEYKDKLAWDLLASDAVTCLNKKTLAALCALIEVIFQIGTSMPWRLTCHVAEVFHDIIPDLKSNMAVAKLDINKMKTLLADTMLQSWLKDLRHQDLVDGFLKMNASGRSFLVKDPCNKKKDVAVMASVTGNTECLFLHLRSHQRNSMVGQKFDKMRI